MTAEQLLNEIRSRQQKKTPFNYGILTADLYVKTIQEAAGDEICYQYMSKKTTSFNDLLVKASKQLVYCNEDMVVEEKSTDDNELEIPDGVELPKNTLMVFKHVLTTPRKDRDGDILRTEGMVPDPKMLLLWQHVHTLPIGKMIHVVDHDSKVLRLISCIVDMNELCHDAAVMVDNKMGRFSHGFRALKFDKVKEMPEGGEAGFDIKEAEIMEESLVSVPANPDAESEEVLLSLVEGGKLTSPIMKGVGKGIRSRMPATVPVNVDLKVSVNGKDLGSTDDEENSDDDREKSGTTGAPEEAVEGTDKETEERGREEKTTDTEVKSVGYGDVPDSYEYLCETLNRKVRGHLKEKGVMSGDDSVYEWGWTIATYDSFAIVCYEKEVDDGYEQKYFKLMWHKVDDEPEFHGDVKEVDVKTKVIIEEKGLLESAKKRFKEDKPENKDDEDTKDKEVSCQENATGFLSKASRDDRKAMLRILNHLDEMDKREENTKAFVALRGE